MKFALISAVAALGFASAAVAEQGYANDTIMTRSIPAESILHPRDEAIAKSGYVSVTYGQKLMAEAGDVLNPREGAIAENGAVNSYVFGGSFADTVEGNFSYR
ncbi:hypothetical protein ACSSNL_10080 [Thalassobius sp. S69A]|uniref:hypothetical protein n=1 Tax=unclassified Thalassovita TaxID=2619711 RepID=UPI000C0F7582|nr:hypothetical protein [Paracoccaceae bacterium]MBT25541.1 hypothetical protein [Paracoccaceae bacterium]